MKGKDPKELIARVTDIPPLPAVATRVMGLADSDRTSAPELASVLSADQGLTAQLIRVSNSAYFGAGRQVGSVREAVVLLGFRQVRQLAVGASIMNNLKRPHTQPDGFDIDLFWGHSVAVAIAADAVGRAPHTPQTQDALTAGIVHDIGRLVLRHAMPIEFREAVAMAAAGSVSLHDAELEVTGYCHEELGQALGEQWRFPAHLVEAIGRHHEQGLTVANDGLPALLALANELAHSYGLLCGYEIHDAPSVAIPQHLEAFEREVGGMDRLLERAFGFIEGASGAPNRWFAQAS
jgi:HD-like signal output (HDOD) protein